jgi:hypothetical protein
MIGVQRYAVLSLVVLGRLARGRTKLANLPSEGSWKILQLVGILVLKTIGLSLLLFL